jgi:hypothetical protein
MPAVMTAADDATALVVPRSARRLKVFIEPPSPRQG